MSLVECRLLGGLQHRKLAREKHACQVDSSPQKALFRLLAANRDAATYAKSLDREDLFGPIQLSRLLEKLRDLDMQ